MDFRPDDDTTSHWKKRDAEGKRPTGQARQDIENAEEIYEDFETGNRIYIGLKGRTHVVRPDGLIHTSFRTTLSNRVKRVINGKWQRIK